MIISEERQQYFAHILIDGLWGDEIIDFDEEQEDLVIRHTKRLIAQWVEEQGDVDEEVRDKLSRLKRNLPEGSAEWKVMYQKYYNEAMSRRGFKP